MSAWVAYCCIIWRENPVHIIVINASPKKEGAVSTLAAEAAQGAADQGASIEHLRLADLRIGYCTFCMTCYRDRDAPIGRCVLNDDMRWILPKLQAADGYIIATQVSSGHANAIFKTFFERCMYTAGSSKGKVLWLKGIPTPRFTDRQRFSVTIAAAGTIPTWLRRLCDIASSQMKELGDCALNARVVGSLYAGQQTFRGLRDRDRLKARQMGAKLADVIRRAHG